MRNQSWETPTIPGGRAVEDAPIGSLLRGKRGENGQRTGGIMRVPAGTGDRGKGNGGNTTKLYPWGQRERGTNDINTKNQTLIEEKKKMRG